MISLIRGLLIDKQPPALVVDVQGVGYELQASMNTFYKLPAVGEQVQLLSHLIVREDAHLLFGFVESRERELFRTLIKVNGVGPKLALTILSSMPPDEFIQCVSDNNSASLVRMPGVGKKTAERLIIEMRDRFSDWQEELTPIALEESAGRSGNTAQDAVSALVALGYKQQQAVRQVKSLLKPEMSCEEVIRLALKDL